ERDHPDYWPERRWSGNLWRTTHLTRTGEQGPNDSTARDAYTSSSRLFADVESNKCYWWCAIVHGHGDAERTSSRRRCASYAFQQQRGSQRAFQCLRPRRKHPINQHRQHESIGSINPRNHLRVLWSNDNIARDAHDTSSRLFADVESNK